MAESVAVALVLSGCVVGEFLDNSSGDLLIVTIHCLQSPLRHVVKHMEALVYIWIMFPGGLRVLPHSVHARAF